MTRPAASQVLLTIFILALCLLTGSCSGVEMVYLPTPTEGQAAVPVDSTATASSVPTAAPSHTPTPEPTDTQLPTAKASLTSPPVVTSTPEASLTPAANPPEIPSEPISLVNASRVKQVAVWGRGSAEQVVSANSGQLLLVRTPFGLYIYDSNTQVLVEFLPDVQTLAVSPDTALVAVAYPGGVVQVWEMGGLQQQSNFQHTLDVPEYPPPGYDQEQQLAIQSMMFSPQRDLLAVGYGDGVIDLFDIKTGEFVHSMHSYYTPFPAKLVFSPDQRYLLSINQGLIMTSTSRINIGVWSVDTGEVEGYLGDTGIISENPFSPDGKAIVTSKWGGFLIRYSIPEGQILGTIPTGLYLPSVEYATDGQHLLVDGGQQVRRIYDGTQALMDNADLESIRPPVPAWLGELPETRKWELGHAAGLFALYLGDDQNISAWGQVNQVTYRWDLGNTQVQEVPWAVETGALAVSNNQAFLAACSGGRFLVIEAQKGVLQDWGGCQPAAVAFSPADDLVAKAHLGLVHILRLPGGELVHNLRGHNLTPQLVRYSQDGRHLISGNIASGRWEVILWQTEPAASLQRLTFDEWSLQDLAISPDADYLVTSGDKLRFWRVTDGWQEKYITLPAARLAFHPSKNLLAVGDWQGVIRLLVVPNGDILGVLEGHRGPITDLRFSPGGTSLVSASEDGTIRLWGVGP